MIFGHRLGYRIWRKVRFFFQRLKRGFDDSDTWDLYDTFYRWLLPRLKRFSEITCAYPTNYKSFDKWKKELDARVKQLDMIVNVVDYEFNEYRYIPKAEVRKLLKRGMPKECLNVYAKDWCIQDFNKWFAEKVNELWW